MLGECLLKLLGGLRHEVRRGLRHAITLEIYVSSLRHKYVSARLRYPDKNPYQNPMYIIPIAWIYVALMMAVAEATNSNGSVLGAFFTFLLYGVLPVALMMYFLGTPGRKRALRAKEQAERDAAVASHETAAASLQPDTGGHAPADPVAPVAEKP